MFIRVLSLFSIRMGSSTFNRILTKIEGKISGGKPAGDRCYNSSVGKVPASTKLAMAIRYLAGGSYLDIKHEFGVSRSFFFKGIWEVFAAIDASFESDLLPVPTPDDEPSMRASKVAALEALARGYERRSTLGGISKCVGAADGASGSCMYLSLSFPPLFCLFLKICATRRNATSIHAPRSLLRGPVSSSMRLRSFAQNRAAQVPHHEPRAVHVPKALLRA